MSQALTNIVQDNDRAGPKASLHVEMIADLVCPFCFVGKRRLNEALKAVQGPSEVSWHPYQLNPDIPASGLPFDVYLTTKFGSPANVEPVLQYLQREGESVGIDFRFDRIRHVPNTLVVHQLLLFAATLGKDPAAIAEDLMSAFFENGINIGEREALVDIAGRHDIGSIDVNKAIDSDEMRQFVVSREQQVRSGGLAGVPGFLVNRRLLVVGAQPTDVIVNVFDRAMFGKGTGPVVSPTLH